MLTGMVHVADAYTIKLTSFNYNGMGPGMSVHRGFIAYKKLPSDANSLLQARAW